MKRYITTLVSLLITYFALSKNIKVDLVDLGKNQFRCTLTNIGNNQLIILGLSPADDYGNTFKPSKSYYYLNLYDINTHKETYSSRIKYLGVRNTSKYQMFLPLHPGESYDLFEFFHTDKPSEGFFSNSVSGTFNMHAVFNLNIRIISSTTSTKEDITVISNTIRYTSE
jgi:hypothetical protein